MESRVLKTVYRDGYKLEFYRGTASHKKYKVIIYKNG